MNHKDHKERKKEIQILTTEKTENSEEELCEYKNESTTKITKKKEGIVETSIYRVSFALSINSVKKGKIF